MDKSRGRGWSFVLQTPNPATVLNGDELRESFKIILNNASYWVCQLEKGNEGENYHIQGYLCFKNQKTLSGVKKLFLPHKPHLEFARGNPEQNRTYCTKEETRQQGPWEYGELPKKGKRNDLKHVARIINEGGSINDIWNQYPTQLIRYNTGIKNCLSLKYQIRPENIEKTVYYFYGKTKTGKSTTAYEIDPLPYKCPTGKNVFDNYEGEKTILFDDNLGLFSIIELLTYLDKYPVKLNQRYTWAYGYHDKVIICWNQPPEDLYPNNSLEQREALIRRFTFIVHFYIDEKGQYCNILRDNKLFY